MGERVAIDVEVVAELLRLDGAAVLDLGCGAAPVTRALAAAHPTARFRALEVDAVQHAANLAGPHPPNLEFGEGGAEAIPAGECAFDAVLMFKSLHHVPAELLDRAMAEIRRVLRPGGLAYLCEPVYAGALNEVVRLFHDEERVRRLALEAIERAVRTGVLERVAQRNFLAPVRFQDFAEFEKRMIGTTHTRHALTPAQAGEVRERFMRHVGPEGALFHAPMRVDLLRRPLS